MDIFCEVRDFSGNVLNRIVHKFPFNSWKTEFQKVYAGLRTSYFNENELLIAKIGSSHGSMSMLDFKVINESDNSVKTIPTRISMNFLIYKKEFSSFNQLDTAFESELTAVGKRQRDFLIELIQSNFDFFKMLPIYAPYTSLIQSSGYGKSKLTNEILKLKPGVSLVFRNQSERGYPIQTEWVKDFEQFIYGSTLDELPLNVADWKNLKAIEYSPGRVLLGILIILEAYISWFWKLRLSGLSREESIQFIGKHFISSSSKWGDQNNTLTFNEGSFCSEFTIYKTVTWISALSANRTTDIHDFSHNFGFPRKAVEELFPEYENFPFLFFFDEISNFDRKAPLGRLPGIHVLQRAFHALKTIPKIMAIAIGTAIDAWNFYPAVRDKYL